MKSKVIITIVTFLITILAACSSPINENKLPKEHIQNSYETDLEYNEENILTSLEKEDISLYYKVKENNFYNGMYLTHKDTVGFYEWNCREDELFLPELISIPKDQHVAVNLVKEHGSGLHICEIHVINLEDMKEILIELPESILEERLKGRINAEEGKVYFDYDNIKIQIDLGDMEAASNYFSEIAFGGLYNYYTENDVLYCEMGLQISPAIFIGNMKIGYQYKDNKYKVVFLDFLPAYEEITTKSKN